jgi:hypothetical protein
MKQNELLGLVRHVLTFVGGIIVTKGLIDESLFEEVLGGIMTLVGAGWSIVAKKKAA